MSVDLLGTVKLLHTVFGFLASRSGGELSDIVAGRAALTVVPSPQDEANSGQAPVSGNGPPAGLPTPVPGPQPSPGTADYSAIVAELRGQQSTADGDAYLNTLTIRGKKATKTDLIAIGAAMGLTLGSGTLKAEAVRKLVEHAIGTHRKFAGLKAW